jgi:hypothetical protein
MHNHQRRKKKERKNFFSYLLSLSISLMLARWERNEQRNKITFNEKKEHEKEKKNPDTFGLKTRGFILSQAHLLERKETER